MSHRNREDPMWDGLQYPGHGYQPAERGLGAGGKPNPATLFGMLAKGRSLGKKVAVGVVGGISFDSKVNVLEIRGDDEAAMNLNVQIQPPRVIPVGGANQITNAQAIALIESQQASGSRLNSDPGLAALNFIYTPTIAVLEWGIGGTANDGVEVDISNGLCVNLSASFLRISVQIDPNAALYDGTFIGDSAIYELGAFVGPGFTQPSSTQRTILLPTIGTRGGGVSGFTPVYPIPRYAKSVRVVCVNKASVIAPPTTGWSCQIVFYSAAGAGLYILNGDPVRSAIPVGNATITDNGSLDSIPVPSGAYYFAIFNSTGNDIQPTAIFDLAI